jgi:hypothetical protein
VGELSPPPETPQLQQNLTAALNSYPKIVQCAAELPIGLAFEFPLNRLLQYTDCPSKSTGELLVLHRI